MSEELQESGQQPDIGRLIGVARRRRLQFIIPFFCGWLLVWGASWVIPARYRSGTLILVQEPSMPNYVVPNIGDDIQARLESMTQQILSRTRLLVIIEKLHLYEGKTPESAEEKVDQMRKDITVELVRDSRKENITAFRIYYTAKDPRLAQSVTGELTSLFINENLKTRQMEAEGTTNFIQKQLDDARAALADQESKVKTFEGQHLGELPTQQAGNLQILAGLQAQLQNEQDALNTARQQRTYLQAMLEQEKATQNKMVPATGANPGGPTDLTAIDQELEKMRAQLADLSSRYTDRYPDVQNLKNQIAQTEASRSRIATAIKERSNETKPSDDLMTDPTLGTAARQLQGQLQANQLEIANREHSITELKERIGQYQGRLNSAPATEQQLADLTRGYDQSKANYDDLLKKRDQSQMATSMEQMQQGERFTMLDPPTLPIKPDFPNRLKFFAMGLGFGFALGFVVAAGLEFIDDRMHSEEEIKGLLPITVLSDIPEMENSADQEHARRTSRMEWATTVALLALIVAGAAFSYLHG